MTSSSQNPLPQLTDRRLSPENRTFHLDSISNSIHKIVINSNNMQFKSNASKALNVKISRQKKTIQKVIMNLLKSNYENNGPFESNSDDNSTSQQMASQEISLSQEYARGLQGNKTHIVSFENEKKKNTLFILLNLRHFQQIQQIRWSGPTTKTQTYFIILEHNLFLLTLSSNWSIDVSNQNALYYIIAIICISIRDIHRNKNKNESTMRKK